MKNRNTYIVFTLLLSFSNLFSLEGMAQTVDNIFKAAGTPANPKVSISWNRYYNYDGITIICDALAKAYPDLVSKKSIGKSYLGKDIWLLEITDSKTLSAED